MPTMTRLARARIYIGAVAVGGAAVAISTAWNTPLMFDSATFWLVPTLIGLVALAGRFPLKLSDQTEAALFTVPLFMGVLLLHPLEAALVAATGVLVSESLLKAPTRAIVFNVSVNGVAAALAGLTFWSLRPEGLGLTLDAGYIFAVAESALVLHLTNAVLVVGMVAVTRGLSTLRHWKATYIYEVIQDGGTLTIGFVGALLTALAWWGMVVLVIPFVLAFYGFRRSIGEAAKNARLAENLSLAQDFLDRSLGDIAEKTTLIAELEGRLRELKEVQAQLIQSAKLTSVGTLDTGIAHEINNPLFAITAHAELLLMSPQQHFSDQMAVQSVRTMRDMGMRISGIVRHLLDYARPADQVQVVPMSDVIEAALTLLGAKTKMVEIDRQYGEELAVAGIPSQLQQVFVNLVGNAIDATDEDGTITAGWVREGSTAVAYVRDTGAGIPKHVHDRLFEPFFSTKDVGKGTGLGLYISHKIVAAHRGTIWIDSEEGTGTTVWVKLPLAEIDAVIQAQIESVAMAADGDSVAVHRR